MHGIAGAISGCLHVVYVHGFQWQRQAESQNCMVFLMMLNAIRTFAGGFMLKTISLAVWFRSCQMTVIPEDIGMSWLKERKARCSWALVQGQLSIGEGCRVLGGCLGAMCF